MPTTGEIITLLQPVNFKGNEHAVVKELLQLGQDVPHEHALVWCADKNKEKLLSVTAGSVILGPVAFEWLGTQNATHAGVNYIVTENPRRAFLKTVKQFFHNTDSTAFVQPSAQIHRSATIDRNTAQIGHHVVIEKDVYIGQNVRIAHNTVILAGTHIGNNVSIGSNCTVGGVGFGYEKDENGEYELIPHIGNVVIEDHVEIGNNVAIDRAVLGSTRIGKNVKIDNLVHIAHGVQIDENSLIIANSMVAGSVKIGKNVWVAPSTSIIQNIRIGDDALIGMASNVLKEVEPGSVVAGNPAKKLK